MRDLQASFPRPCDERWDAMTPAGCGRLCGRCDKLVHDLSLHSFDEAETLLSGNPDVCVRARIDTDGSVALRPNGRGEARRMVVAIAATAGLLTASAPAYAKQNRPDGAIAGKMYASTIRTRVIATGTNGQTYRTTVKVNGRFRIKHLPTGTYSLTFRPSCGESWTVDNVVVSAGETASPEIERDSGCIVIGMLRVERHTG